MSTSNSFLCKRKNLQLLVKPHHGQRVPLTVPEKVFSERLPLVATEGARVKEERLECRRGGAAVLDLQIVVAESRDESRQDFLDAEAAAEIRVVDVITHDRK